MKSKKNIIIISAVSLAVIAAVLLSVFVPPAVRVSRNLNAALLPRADADVMSSDGDKIHFLNTGNSDAILLESDGKFALIDAGEDNDNPRNFADLELPGFEQRVLDYLKSHAADGEGKVHLDFVLGTHAHSDHIGGFDTIIADPDVTVGRAYLKTYDSSKIRDYEIEAWDNQEVYDQMVGALQARNVPIVFDPDGTPFQLGNYTIKLFNTQDPETSRKVGENDQSFGILVEKNGTRVFLSGDMDNSTGDERRLASEIGEVHLLKVGHHGYAGSSSAKFVRTLSPEACVFTNYADRPNRTVLMRFQRICKPGFYFTGKENGVLAVIGDNGNITYYGGLHEE